MPRNSAGVYTLPPTNPVVPFTTIATSWANPTMSDIATALTDSLDRNGRGGMLAPFKIYDGTQGAPGLGFLNEPSLGIYRSGSGVMNFVSGGQTWLDISASGVVSPTKFNVYGQQQYRATGFKWWQVSNPNGNLYFTPSATADTEDWDGSKAIIFQPNGSISIPPGGLAYLPLTGGTLSGALTVGGALTVNAASYLNGLLSVTNPGGTAAFYGYKGDAVPASGVSITRLYGYGNTPTASYKPAGGIEVRANENWTDSATGGVVAIRAAVAGTTNFVDVASFSPTWSTINSQILLNDTNAGSPTTGKIGFGNTVGPYLQFDGTNFVLAGGGWFTVTNNVAVANALQYKFAQPVTFTADIGGPTVLTPSNGLALVLAISTPAQVSFAGIPNGAIMRVVFTATNVGLTFTGINWPNGVDPNFTTGPLKKALVVVTNDGGNYLGTYSVF